MTNLHSMTTVLAAALALSACVFDAQSDEAVVEEESLFQQLGTRLELELEPSSLVGVLASDRNGNALPCLQPDVVGGSAILRSTNSGLLLVEDLTIDLSDLRVEPGLLHSEAVQLTEIRLRLGTQIVLEPDWTSGEQVQDVGLADLLLDWSVLDDSGEVFPLATQRLRDAEFAVRVYRSPDGSVTAAVTTAVPGPLVSFANRIELSDFSMAVTASTQK